MFGGQNQQRSRVVPSVGSRLYDMLNSDVLTDVTFIVQGTEIKGHKVIASSHGGLLRELIETSENNRIEITEEVAPHTFKTVLQYLYTDSSHVSDQNLFEVTHAAKIFGLAGLESACAEIVKGKLTERNVGVFTSQALQFDVEENIKVCQEYFRNNTSKIIKTKEFLKVSRDVLSTLCSSEGITFSELDLFLACVKWAKCECRRRNRETTPANLRAALGNVLDEIRFPCIPKKDFEDFVVPLEILTYDEIGRIIVGWKKNENRSPYSNHCRTEIVQVRVKDYRVDFQDSRMNLPSSTTIFQLKGMRIFNGGNEQYPAEQFTISFNDKELFNDVTLASIYMPGEELILRVHSVTILARETSGVWECPVTIKSEDLWERGQNIVLGHLLSYKDITPDQVKDIYRVTRGGKYKFPRSTTVQPGITLDVELQ